jgi:hypothetical protein
LLERRQSQRSGSRAGKHGFPLNGGSTAAALQGEFIARRDKFTATNSKKKPAGTGPRALTHSLHCNLSFQFSAAWSPAIGGIFGCKRSPAQAE